MKWHPLLAFTLVLSNAAFVAAQDYSTYRGQHGTFVAAGKRTPMAQRAPKAKPARKKHASHSLFGSWNPFEVPTSRSTFPKNKNAAVAGR